MRYCFLCLYTKESLRSNTTRRDKERTALFRLVVRIFDSLWAFLKNGNVTLSFSRRMCRRKCQKFLNG